MNEPSSVSAVLLVEDDPLVGEVLRGWLDQAGYAVEVAAHSRAARAMIGAREPAVVMCEADVAGPDGLCLVDWLRVVFPHIATVLCTPADQMPGGRAQPDDVVGYVLKPFRRAQVLAVVADAVAWHAARMAGAVVGYAPRPCSIA